MCWESLQLIRWNIQHFVEPTAALVLQNQMKFVVRNIKSTNYQQFKVLLSPKKSKTEFLYSLGIFYEHNDLIW